MIFSQASFARAQVEQRRLTARLRERREQVRVIETHGLSGSHLTSSWAFGSVTTTTPPPGASPVVIYQRAFGMNSSRSPLPRGPRSHELNRKWRRLRLPK